MVDIKNWHVNAIGVNRLRKILPLVCLIIPWEYFSNDLLHPDIWGFKFSLFTIVFGFYDHFQTFIQYMSNYNLQSILTDIRMLSWLFGTIISILLVVYELLRETLNIDFNTKTTAYAILVCGILSAISFVSRGSSSWTAFPIAPFFYVVFANMLLKNSGTKS